MTGTAADFETMNFEDWCKKYKPINNDVVENASFQDESGKGIMFETYGPELEEVRNTAANLIWTLIDVGCAEPDEEGWDENDSGMVLSNGYHYVNRIGYFIASIPFEGNFMEVSV